MCEMMWLGTVPRSGYARVVGVQYPSIDHNANLVNTGIQQGYQSLEQVPLGPTCSL